MNFDRNHVPAILFNSNKSGALQLAKLQFF